MILEERLNSQLPMESTSDNLLPIKINDIVIVGGGSSGWLAALFLLKIFNKHFQHFINSPKNIMNFRKFTKSKKILKKSLSTNPNEFLVVWKHNFQAIAGEKKRVLPRPLPPWQSLRAGHSYNWKLSISSKTVLSAFWKISARFMRYLQKL